MSSLHSFANTLVNGRPPSQINVLDGHGGFTAVTQPGRHMSNMVPYTSVHERDVDLVVESLHGSSLWRPGHVLKKSNYGTLLGFNEKSFYQTNNDVTKAIYKVPGYRYPVAVWFDNKTGRRIA